MHAMESVCVEHSTITVRKENWQKLRDSNCSSSYVVYSEFFLLKHALGLLLLYSYLYGPWGCFTHPSTVLNF